MQLGIPESTSAGNTGSQSGAVPSLDALVLAVAGGDPGSLSLLYGQTVAQVFAIARAILHSKEDAEEVVCDLYRFVWQRAEAFDPGRGSVMAWLAVMVRNRAVDRLRQRRAHLSLDDERQEGLVATLAHESPGPEQMLAKFQSGSAVHRALETLTPQRRHLLSLAFFEGLSHQEIADVVGLPLGTVKSHVRRSLAALQGELSADG